MAPFEDANYIAKDYGVCVGSTLDLRFLAVMAKCEPHGLAKLSQEHLNIKLNKDWRIRCSNWEARDLLPKQIDYAAKDAQVAIEIFKVLTKKLTQNNDFREVLDRCYGFLDMRFSHLPLIANASTSTVGQSKMSLNKL